MQGGGIGVEAFAGDGDDVTPPLAALTVRAVEEVVAGIDIDRPQTFVPEFVEELIVTGKGAFHEGVVAGFPVGKVGHAGAMLHGKFEFHPVQPAQRFVGLFTRLGDILGPEALLPYFRMVGFNQDAMAAFRIRNGQDRRHLHVVRKRCGNDVGIGTGHRLESQFLHPVILPLRNRPQIQVTQCILHRDSGLEAFQAPGPPPLDILPGIETQAGFGKTVVRGRAVGDPIGRMDPAQPLPFRERRRIKPQLRTAAGQVREPVLTEIPLQEGEFVLTLTQVGSQVDLIEITVLRVRPPLQSPFEDHQVPVDPEPVLAVHGNPGRNRRRHFLQVEIPAVGDPDIDRIRHVLRRQRHRHIGLGNKFHVLRPGAGACHGHQPRQKRNSQSFSHS